MTTALGKRTWKKRGVLVQVLCPSTNAEGGGGAWARVTGRGPRYWEGARLGHAPLLHCLCLGRGVPRDTVRGLGGREDGSGALPTFPDFVKTLFAVGRLLLLHLLSQCMCTHVRSGAAGGGAVMESHLAIISCWLPAMSPLTEEKAGLQFMTRR